MTAHLADLYATLPAIGLGVAWTVVLFCAGCLLSLLVTSLLAVASHSPVRALRATARRSAAAMSAIPPVVLLFWLAFALPVIIGGYIEPVVAAMCALGLVHGAQGAALVRGAMTTAALPRPARAATGLGRRPRVRLIVIWPRLVEVMPRLSVQTVSVLKNTSLAALIGVSDLTFNGQQNRMLAGPVLVLGAVLCVYFALAAVVSAGMRALERAARRRVRSRPAATAVPSASPAPVAVHLPDPVDMG